MTYTFSTQLRCSVGLKKEVESLLAVVGKRAVDALSELGSTSSSIAKKLPQGRRKSSCNCPVARRLQSDLADLDVKIAVQCWTIDITVRRKGRRVGLVVIDTFDRPVFDFVRRFDFHGDFEHLRLPVRCAKKQVEV